MTIHMRLDETGKTLLAYPYNPEQIRVDFPNTSFPANLTPDVLASFNVVEVREVPPPVADFNQTVKEGDPRLISGTWMQNWKVTKIDAKLLAERTDKERKHCWNLVKTTRSRLTAEGGVCVEGDWYATDLMSRSKYQNLLVRSQGLADDAVLSNDQGDVVWKLMDNRLVPMTVARIKAVVTAIDNQDTAIFNHASDLSVELGASKAPMTVDIINGWPTTYKA